MKKRTTVSNKPRKISYQLSRKSPKKKIARRKRKEGKKAISFALSSFIVFLLTFVFMYLLSPLNPSGLISPMPIKDVKEFLVREDNEINAIQKLFSEKNIPYATIARDSGSTFIVTLKSKEVILLTSDSDLIEQVSSLQVILTRLTMEGKKFKRLDVRFDKPVITYK